MVSETKLLKKHFCTNDPSSADKYISSGGYTAFLKALHAPCECLETITASGLRGRSGSGFPTGLKWKTVKDTSSDMKYIVCNADEGEPGTGKDRILLSNSPHLIIEGMLIAGICVGACKGIIYIRGEYRDIGQIFSDALNSARLAGYLGSNIHGSDFSFDIDVIYGAGAYICGEETALLESIEGHRGEARLKPPYPGVSGLREKPTVINNVETFANIPIILDIGPDQYKAYGTDGYSGTKLITISGCVAKPGIYEVSVGLTIRDILNMAGGCREGKTLFAIQTGGGSGTIVGLDALDTVFDITGCNLAGAFFGAGDLMFIDADTDLVDLCINIISFFEMESCGRCVPCRIGLPALKKILTQILDGGHDLTEKLRMLAENIRDSARCPLCGAAVTPVLSAFRSFPAEFDRNNNHVAGEGGEN